MLVALDTSALIAVITGEAHRGALVAATRGAELVSPASLPAEVGNAFSAMFKRGRITLEQAYAATAAYRRIPIRLVEVDLDRSLELATRLGVYAYDAYVIACALDHAAPLLTLDGGQREAARRAGAQILEVEP